MSSANTHYGDRSPIEDEVMDHLREAYRSATVSFPWQKDTAQHRQPLAGRASIRVGVRRSAGGDCREADPGRKEERLRIWGKIFVRRAGWGECPRNVPDTLAGRSHGRAGLRPGAFYISYRDLAPA